MNRNSHSQIPPPSYLICINMQKKATKKRNNKQQQPIQREKCIDQIKCEPENFQLITKKQFILIPNTLYIRNV